MKNFENFFRNEELVELTKKNMEFTWDLFKSGMKNAEDMTKENVNRYFGIVQENIDTVAKNYDKAAQQGTEVLNVYKENLEKTYQISKDMMEKIKNA